MKENKSLVSYFKVMLKWGEGICLQVSVIRLKELGLRGLEWEFGKKR